MLKRWIKENSNYLKELFYITRENVKTLLVSTLFYNKELILKNLKKLLISLLIGYLKKLLMMAFAYEDRDEKFLETWKRYSNLLVIIV